MHNERKFIIQGFNFNTKINNSTKHTNKESITLNRTLKNEILRQLNRNLKHISSYKNEKGSNKKLII